MKDVSGRAAPPTEGQEQTASAQEAKSGRRRNDGQFKAGHSGNSRGRPRGARCRKTIAREIAAEVHWVMDGDNRRRLTTCELIFITIRNLAAEGDPKAFRAFERCLDRYGPKEPEHRGGYLVVPEGCHSLEEAERLGRELTEWQRREFGDWDPGKEE